MLTIPRRTVVVIGRVREVGTVVSVYLPAIGGDVVWRAVAQAVGAAP